MRMGVFVFALACILGCYACGHTNAGTKARSTSSIPLSGSTKSEAMADSSAALAAANLPGNPTTDAGKISAKVDFPTKIRPILEARCQPCHFSGGKVYQQMPFDRPETIKTLGTKLFTRIKDENERRLIRDFLAQD
jgi:hypothetical protein